MSDEIKKDISTSGGAVATEDAKDRLQEVSRRLSVSKNSPETILSVSSDKREERIAQAQERMRVNIARAEREAAEQRAIAESMTEYKLGIIERENKKAIEERRERVRAAKEKRERAKEERVRAREEYLLRERAAIEAENGGVLSLLARSSDFDGQINEAAELTVNNTEQALCANDGENQSAEIEERAIDTASETVCEAESTVEETKADGESESEIKAESTAEETEADGESESEIKAESTAEEIKADGESESISEACESAKTEDDPILINIGKTERNRSTSGDSGADGELKIFIPAYAYAHPRESAYERGYGAYPSPRADFSEEFRAAEERHVALRRAAVERAAGVYSEELRLLADEEARYFAELTEIRNRRNEYTELISSLSDEDCVGLGMHAEGRDAARQIPVRTESGDGVHAFERQKDYESYGAAIGEEAMLKEYGKYRESRERANARINDTGPVGEALPYSDHARNFVTEAGDNRFDAYDEIAYSEDYSPHRASVAYADEFGNFSTYGYGLDSDRAAVRRYEEEMAKKDEAERNARTGTSADADIDRKAIEDAEHEEHRYYTEGIDYYTKSQLAKRLDKFYKEEAALLKKNRKLERERSKSGHEESVSVTVEMIAIAKELCEMAAEILSACVYVGAKLRTSKHKRLLIGYIDKYNELCDEYETRTGRPLERIDYAMVDDVMAGRLYRPIQNVYYYGTDDDFKRWDITPKSEREHRIEAEEDLVSQEYERYALDGEFPEYSAKEKRASMKRRSERMSSVKRAAERDVLLIGLRTEFRISELEAKRDVLSYSYDVDKVDRARELRKLEKKIERIKADERRASELERQDNSRYYYLSAVDMADERIKGDARVERLEALRLRLNVLLSERENINERLIALYGGTDNRLKKAKVSRKASTVRKKAAKAMYKRQRPLAREIERLKASRELKEHARELLNMRISEAAECEAAKYTLRKLRPSGRAYDELSRTVKRAKKNMRYYEREIRYLIKRLKKQAEDRRNDFEWAVFLISLFIISALAVFAWMKFGDRIIAYFIGFKNYFGF